MTEEWRWIGAPLILAIHDEQLAEHGGSAGVRDLALLESALARPQNLAAYGTRDVFDLAAAYAYGIARNHAFVDGNKRTAFVAAVLFLLDHGHELEAAEVAAVTAMMNLAEGRSSQEEFADWLRANCVPGPTEAE